MQRAFARELALALALALLLTAVWAARDWADLAALILPDTDDAMRLQQVRDWLAGQSFSDLRQHRLGAPPGLAMHWSRFADLGPAAIILALRPGVGPTSAEVTAVIAYPALLFGSMLVLIACITGRVAGRAAVVAAMIMAAIAYPAITLFMPGRIDHHGLQLVLLLAAILGLVGPPTVGRGAAIGACSAASLFVGFELIPFLAVIGAAAVSEWIFQGDGRRLGGIALGLGLFAIPGLALVPATSSGFCDAISPGLFAAMGASAISAAAMARIGSRIAIMPRLVIAIGLGSALAGFALLIEPSCLSGPYGAVDPMVSQMWLGNVGEAKALLASEPAIAIGYVGLLIAGIVASILNLRAEPGARGWWIILALQLASLGLAFAQIRGVYPGVLLAAPALAALVARARVHGGSLALAIAWLAGAGILYPLVGQSLFASAASSPGAASPSCTEAQSLAVLRALPPGRLMAPVDIGAYVIGGTRHSVVAAPYHRNNVGNAAMYRFFLGDDRAAQGTAERLGIDYVLLCPGSFAELGDPPANSLLLRLRQATPPAWLMPLGAEPMLYAVRGRLKARGEAP